MSLFSWLGNVAAGTERQLNFLDNNKTYKNKVGNPNDTRSTFQQAKDVGTGVVKSAVEPFSWLIKTDIINPAKELLAKTPEQKAKATRESNINLGLGPEGNNLAGGLRKLTGESAGAFLTFLAPGEGKVISSALERRGVEGAANRVLTAGGTGAAVGAPFGAASAIADTNQPLTIENLLRSAGYGAAAGAVLGGGGATLGEGARLASSAYKTRTPLNQVGAVGRDVTPEETAKLAKAKSPADIKKVLQDVVPADKVDALVPAIAQANDKNIVRNLIHEANTVSEPAHVKQFVQQYADALQQMEGSLKGGQKVPSAEGGFVRTSEHTPFYRKFYQANGRAPTRKDFYQEAQRQLQSGKADSFAQAEYDGLNNPEVMNLLSQNPAYFSQDNRVGEVSQPTAPPVVTVPAGKDINGVTLPEGQRQRQFLKSASESPNLSPETQQAVKDITPQTYEQKPNATLVAKTKAFVDKNPEGALRRALGESGNSKQLDEDIAIGQHLIQKFNKEGKTEAALQVVERLDTKLRDAGRGVQAGSLIDRLSPEGVLLYAQRRVRKVREAGKDFSKEKPTAQDIQKQVEGFDSPETAKNVRSTIQDTVQQISGEGSSTAERLAKNVGKAASPVIKKKADVLVNELTKRVKQEYLEPKAKVETPPLQILQEVFGRNKEAQEAYPVAQSILREKYAGNEVMQAALDKFFGSNLGPVPAASSTINRAIAQELKTKQIQVSKAIYQSWAKQRQTVEDIAQALTKEGFDEKSAQVLAKEVTDRLNKQFADAKAATLERLAREAPEKAQQTYIEKLNKLSNIGVLDKVDYIDLARAKLNLPNLSPETATQLSELAQHVQTLPEGAEKYATVRKMRQLIEENTPLTGKQKAAQAIGTPRAIMASGDISFGGRQALAYASAHPIKFAQQWGKQFKYFKEGFQGDDSQAFDNLMGEIQSHPDYEILKKSDLAITDPFGISPQAREEQFIGSNFAEKVPALGRLVRGSNYAFTGLANSIRANEFYAQLDHARQAGIPLSEKLVNDLAKVINNSTGRGSVKALEPHMKSLSTALFAPRLVLSRLQTLNPHYYVTLEPAARKEALRQLMGLSAFAVGVLNLANLVPGVQVGTNPKSSDFGKVKIGDTRLDFLAGYGQYIRLGAQLAIGETVSSISGRESQLGSGYGKKSRKDILAKFLENKENPVVSFATTLLSGQDAVGNPVKTPGAVGQQLASRFVPLVFQDVADMASHKEGLNPVIGAPLALVGVGTQTYGKQDIKLSDKQQAVVDQLKADGAPKAQIKANRNFYQTLKTTPDRNAASQDINDALKKLDYDKAEQIANDYNKKYAASFKDWAKKYSEYEDANLREAYNAGKILLTSANIRERINNIRNNQLTTAALGG